MNAAKHPLGLTALLHKIPVEELRSKYGVSLNKTVERVKCRAQSYNAFQTQGKFIISANVFFFFE